MPEFLAENNLCGQCIVQLVSRGNAIIAEILRLKDYVPVSFRLENKTDISKYGDIIADFSYFKVSEAHEQKIENKDSLQDLDQEFRDNNITIITRFYSLFESIHVYVIDLNQFLTELEDGLYINQSLETIIADVEGKQLLCEALYLYGVMLLLVDAHIHGIIRERLLVAYYRYTSTRRDTRSCIDEVCKLLRDTGLQNKKPNNYPEDYFQRIPIKSSYIDIVLGRLRTDDIYNQLTVYPKSTHRSFALAQQASMLYVCLFFSSRTLHQQTAVMREVVDKYFPDNWIVHVYMGYNVNLAETWEHFKAAKMALNNTLDHGNIKSYSHSFASSLVELNKTIVGLLKEGAITSDNVLNNNNNILSVLRDCNVTIRWLVLHATAEKSEKIKRCKQLRELVVNESRINPVQLFKLLLNTAQLELVTKELLKSILEAKEEKWNGLKEESSSGLRELAEVFGGEKPLTRVQKNLNLKRWFNEISKEVDSLEFGTENSSRKLVQLIQALEEVQEFHQLDSSMQVVQFLTEIRAKMHRMIRNMNIKEDMLITMQIIGDLSYAWEIIDTYTSIMQSGIQKEPTLVIKLRAVFLKLASAMETPLLRINQSHSEDLLSVSEYYSRELEVYIRKVLQIIPNMMFQKMARIIEMQTSILKELPTRLDKDKLKEYAQLNERFEIAELTHSISVFSQGMRMMKSTLVGVVCLDPKVLLEDGIRKELVNRIAQALHNELTFSTKYKPEEFDSRLKSLVKLMDGYKRSFEYVQDYVNINGLKIWQEEVTRIINYNVEQECNGFLRNKIHKWDSVYQNRHVPIPHFPSTDGVSENFIGRLAREILRMTDPKLTLYVPQTTTWYRMQKPVANKQMIASIASAIEITGLVGLDRLFSFMIVTHLRKVLDAIEIRTNNQQWGNIIMHISRESKTMDEQHNLAKVYQNWKNCIRNMFVKPMENVLCIGQLQLLRNVIAFHLNTACKFNAKNLESSLQSLNRALLNDLRKSNANEIDIKLSENFLKELSTHLDNAGLNNPFTKVYLTTKSMEEHSLILFLFVITSLDKVFLLNGTTGQTKCNYNLLDGVSFSLGIHTIAKQLHSDINDRFISNMSSFILHLTKASLGSKNEIANDVILALRFMDHYTNYSSTSLDSFKNHCPEEVINIIRSISTKP